VPIAKSKQTVRSLCADVSPEFVEDFLRRMDEDYFDTFPPEEIAQHLKMSNAVDTNRRDAVRIDAEGEGRFKIVIVGFDYSSGFSILCGLLSAFGLDIRAGDIYTLSRRPGARGGGRIVDIFQVTLKPGESFDQTRQREFEQELQTLTEFLASDSTNEARERLNRFLIERIEKMGEAFSGPGRLSNWRSIIRHHPTGPWPVSNQTTRLVFSMRFPTRFRCEAFISIGRRFGVRAAAPRMNF
jgi:glutamate-ammonia-ligase adenylyltransferase